MKKKCLFIFIYIFLLTSCSIKYNSYEEFQNDKPSDRRLKISKVIKRHDLELKDTLNVDYIEYMLTQDKYYKILTEHFNPQSFDDSLNKSILTLYYCYSPNNFSKANTKWRKKANKFLVNYVTYDFSYGEKKFRKFLEGINVYNKFPYYYLKFINSEIINSISNRLAGEAWISSIFSLSDFKNLNTSEQGDLLSGILQTAWSEMAVSGKDTEGMFSLAMKFDDWWQEYSKEILSSIESGKNSDNITFKNAFGKILKQAMYY